MARLKKLPKQIVGAAGEHYVAGELSKRGYIVSITAPGIEAIDLLCASSHGTRRFNVQVKTNQHGTHSWAMTEKNERDHGADHFYVLVELNALGEAPTFRILQCNEVASAIKRAHNKWKREFIKRGKKKGQPHGVSTFRKFFDREGKYLNRWDILPPSH